MMLALQGKGIQEDRQPVISMVVYLFKSDVVEPHLKEMSGEEELLSFRFRVVPLWTMDGRQFVEEHAISMYTLLPTMKNVDARVLQQAIDEMIQYYGDDERKLARRVFWLKLFLRRSTMITPEDKKKVQERLDTFDQLLEEDEYIQQQRALGREEGEILASRRLLVRVTSQRFPSLLELAQQKAEHTSQPAALDELIGLIVAAPDESYAQYILSSPSAA